MQETNSTNLYNIKYFDLSTIYTRDDGSYVINQGLYHVPNEGEWTELWAQVNAYAKVHPEVVKSEPGKPELTLEEVRAIALSHIDFATSTAILAGFEYTIDNETLYFSYDAFDQQNFADTANGAILALQNVEGVPTTVTWNGYRNHTKEQKGELVRLTLDVSKFLDLYVKGALANKDTQMELGGERKAIISNCTTIESIEMHMKFWYGE
jgi:hypothetical protein